MTRDIQILSQVTTRLRLYGANCNQTALVLQAIQDTKVDMSVYVAICEYECGIQAGRSIDKGRCSYLLDVDSNTDAFETQVSAVEDALKTYGADHVLGVTVGNEYILK